MGNILTLVVLALLLPLQAGIMARSYGRNFWLWFFVTLPLPIISNYILLCLGDKTGIQPVADERKTHSAKEPGMTRRRSAQLATNA